jgi:hypothetical protein
MRGMLRSVSIKSYPLSLASTSSASKAFRARVIKMGKPEAMTASSSIFKSPSLSSTTRIRCVDPIGHMDASCRARCLAVYRFPWDLPIDRQAMAPWGKTTLFTSAIAPTRLPVTWSQARLQGDTTAQPHTLAGDHASSPEAPLAGCLRVHLMPQTTTVVGCRSSIIRTGVHRRRILHAQRFRLLRSGGHR